MADLFAVKTKSSAAKPRMSLHEDVVGRLREMILHGELAPGEWIAEMKLCNDLAISRTPLREALKVLASESLITLLPNRGAIVADIRVEEIADLFEIMDALEALIGRLAVDRASDADIAALQSMHEAMVAHHERGARDAYFDLNQAIHQRIAELSGNASLASTYARLRRENKARPLPRQSFRCAMGRIRPRTQRIYGGVRGPRRGAVLIASEGTFATYRRRRLPALARTRLDGKRRVGRRFDRRLCHPFSEPDLQSPPRRANGQGIHEAAISSL